MSRLKKSNKQNPNQNQSNPNLLPSQNPSKENLDLNQNAIDVDIEGQDVVPVEEDNGFMAKIRRAAEKSGILSDDDEPEKTETRGRKKKTAAQDEFNTLTVALLSLVLAAVNVPENIKPLDNEVMQFSHHLTSLLVRHLPISGKFSADALDVIGLLAVGSAYYARIAPELKNNKPKEKTEEQYWIAENDLKTPPAPADAISRINPSVGSWLSQKANQGG